MSATARPDFTAEQLAAVDRRDGPLILSAAAGSGKTAVLVERYVRSVVDDGLRVGEVLAITFTDQAAAEMRARIRHELRARGRDDLATGAEPARVSTIDALCHRLLRGNALAARIDPGFEVLDAVRADRLARAAYDQALGDLAAGAGEAGLDLLARTSPFVLRAAIRGLHATLRSRGAGEPRLPEPVARDPLAALAALAAACEPAVAEAAAADGRRARAAEEAVGACAALLASAGDAVPEPEALAVASPPGGNGALGGPAIAAYRLALERALRACADHHLGPALASLDTLLRAFGERYARAKRAASAVDFADLELLAVRLLRERPDVREREAGGLRRVMVDELQDINGVQLELLELLAPAGWFAVGDAAQSIYGFRNADVALFRERRAALLPAGAALELRSSFRGHPAVLDVVNVVSGAAIEDVAPLVAARAAAEPDGEPRVELLVTERSGWSAEEVMPAGEQPPCPPWRMAEARTLAARIGELIAGGLRARDVVVLLRAATDLGAYERALDDAGVPTYVIGGRGFWGRREVADLVAWLAVVANARDEPRLWEVLASPLVGLGSGGLVHVAAAARDAGADPWTVLRAAFAPEAPAPPSGLELAAAAAALPAALEEGDRARLESFVSWAERERREAVRRSPAELVARAVAARGFDLALLRMPGGERRLANVRKLQRLASEHERREGPVLRDLLDAVARLSGRDAPGDAREAEAPVEGEELDAVRLMTIHRAKGLEFPVVCVADLGREPPAGQDLVRLGSDGRIGLRMRPLGGGDAVEAFDWPEVSAERREAAEQESRRLFYVAMTRARERLVLCGAAETAKPAAKWRGPLGWIAAALVPDLGESIARGEDSGVARHPAGEREARVAFSISRPGVTDAVATGERATAPFAPARAGAGRRSAPPAPSGRPPAPPAPASPARLSYTALAEAGRCGRRYYLERILRLPAPASAERPAGAARAGGLDAAARGALVHRLLEVAPLGDGTPPGRAAVGEAARAAGLVPGARELDEIGALVAAGASSAQAQRLAAAGARREVRFVVPLAVAGFGDVLLAGAIDVLGIEGGTALVLDWKSDRLAAGEEPERHAERGYPLQRLVYALAALRAGHPEAEIVHLYLERPESPAIARYAAGEADAIESELAARARPILAGELEASPAPWRGLCTGCPGRGTLCPHPRALTERPEPPGSPADG